MVRDIVAGLEGYEKHRESARVRSRVLRMNDAYRLADNVKRAAHERSKYHADIAEGRRKGLEKWRRRRDPISSRDAAYKRGNIGQ